MLEPIAVLIFLAVLVYAGFRDLTRFEIPNWISLVLVADFIVVAVAQSWPWTTIGLHLSAGLAVMVVGAFLFAGGILGGGDAKLLAACAVWFGWSGLPDFFVVVALFGGGLALVVLALRRLPLPAPLARWGWLVRLRAHRGIPYALAIAPGAVLILARTPLAAPWLAAGTT